MPRLAVDGAFGPKTLARVIEFQKQHRLAADGVVGPKTWAALDGPAVRQKAVFCGNSDPGNLARVESIRTQFVAGFGGVSGGAPAFAASSGPTGSRSGFVGGALTGFPGVASVGPVAGFRPFAGSPQDTPNVRSRFGSSIDFASVFITDKTGAQNRPFTVGFAITMKGLPPVIQVMNLGPAPDEDTVIHEMTHVWQSQHHSDPTAFMKNCVACQAAAVAQNGVAAKADVSLLLKTKSGFPVNYPFSAYAYRRGNPFSAYGGEQIAEQVEKNESAIVAKVRTTPARAVDGDNVASLTRNFATEDRRAAGVFI